MVLLIYGTGGAAKEVLDLAMVVNGSKRRWDTIAFVDRPNMNQKQLHGHPIYTLSEINHQFALDQCELVIAIGEPDSRLNVIAETTAFLKATLIHPLAVVSPYATIGDGTIVSAFAYVGSESWIGQHCSIQHHSVVSHNCFFGNNVVFSAHGFVGGGVSVGADTFIGAGALVRENRTIGSHSIVGMGAVVTKSIEDNTIAFGNPLQIKPREPGQRVFRPIS